MLFDKYINREVDRRIHEEMMRRDIWERMDQMQKQIEELRYQVDFKKQCADASYECENVRL